MPYCCRDCEHVEDGDPPEEARCPACRSPRLVSHPELRTLSIAHLDCDAFYATIEKRDRPELADRPVIVGGGSRGVVSAACYIARLYGVRSAMPMFKALAACPDAVVLRPDMAKYSAVGAEARRAMLEVTPLVEPLSIDEAFLDLGRHVSSPDGPPARICARLVRRIESRLGITISVGLSYNKFLAKFASDLEKPRGFSVIGRGDAVAMLADRPVSVLWGVGRALQGRLLADGIRTVGDVAHLDEMTLTARYGSIGRRLWRFSHGEDDRTVQPDQPAKSISAETTFQRDLSDRGALEHALQPLCDRVAERLVRKGLAGRTVVLKLKTARFRLLTRSHRLVEPTQCGGTIFRSAAALLAAEVDGTAYRLIGAGVADLVGDELADPPDLFEPALPEASDTPARLFE
ncbi:MAG: DNA polymerase IV [Rhodospirillaceae bacterium]|nr:DNA polymerase IV [Rhodospirillaceae bacterium]